MTVTPTPTATPHPCGLQGVVREDSNLNGWPDLTEPGIAGIPVRLSSAVTQVAITETVTSSTGEYFFFVPAGSYNVEAVSNREAGWEAPPFHRRADVFVCPGTIHDLDLPIRHCVTRLTVAVNYTEASVAHGLAGVSVNVFKNSQRLMSLTTPASGTVAFELYSGDYELQIIPPTGWVIVGDSLIAVHLDCDERSYSLTARRQ